MVNLWTQISIFVNASFSHLREKRKTHVRKKGNNSMGLVVCNYKGFAVNKDVTQDLRETFSCPSSAWNKVV